MTYIVYVLTHYNLLEYISIVLQMILYSSKYKFKPTDSEISKQTRTR